MSNASTTKAKPEMFDASAINTIEACNKPAEIEIRHPVSGMGTGIFISVVGKDSDIYRGRIRAMADENLRKQATGRTSVADSSIDKLEQKNIDALVAATAGWRTGDEPVVALAGERLEFNPANARRLYTEILPIREQVSDAINDLGNFIQG